MTRSIAKSAKKPAIVRRKNQNASSHATRSASTKRDAMRIVNGIPVKRKAGWVYDTDSPEFKAAWKRERELLRNAKPDSELNAFLEAAARDIDDVLDER
jgi:hypothetical protein